MNHYQYDSLRAYAMEPLASYLGTPLAYDVARLSEKLSGGAARLEHEKNQAMEFWACYDLSPREKAAAHLLAVISNHRAISWWRAPDTPDGTDPLPALESWQEERLCKDTIDAARAYAAFLPEQQAEALVALAPEQRHQAPAPDTAPVVADEVDFTMVATRKELIDAFGKFTDMSMTWFDNLTDTPKLLGARKSKGQGGRHSAEPLFCPYEVMQWLADPKRKKGRALIDTTAWRLLKGNFPKVYNKHSIGDPNAD